MIKLLMAALISAFTMLATPPEPVLSVQLTLRTRGVQKSVVVTAQQTQVDSNGQHWQGKTTPNQWRAVQLALKGLDPATISSLPADASRSSVDAALMAQVHIVTAAGTYESITYDHPDAPTRLKPLVKAILASAPPASRAALR